MRSRTDQDGQRCAQTCVKVLTPQWIITFMCIAVFTYWQFYPSTMSQASHHNVIVPSQGGASIIAQYPQSLVDDLSAMNERTLEKMMADQQERLDDSIEKMYRLLLPYLNTSMVSNQQLLASLAQIKSSVAAPPSPSNNNKAMETIGGGNDKNEVIDCRQYYKHMTSPRLPTNFKFNDHEDDTQYKNELMDAQVPLWCHNIHGVIAGTTHPLSNHCHFSTPRK
jgi:hypothetical protein